MNSKSILASLCLVVIYTQLSAQLNLNYSNSNSKFSITIPGLSNYKFGGGFPYTRYFLETGDGKFIAGRTTGYQQQIIPITWHFNTTLEQVPFVQLNTVYDTISRKPPHAVNYTSLLNIDNGSNAIPDILAGTGANIKISSSVETGTVLEPHNTVIPGDTMTFAITYRKQSGGACGTDRAIVAFFYNKTASGITDLFSELNETIDYRLFNNSTVNMIRKHNNEVLKSFNLLPASIQQSLNSLNQEYGRALFFDVPNMNFTGEKNIFLSMSPNKNLSAYRADNITDSVKAVIIQYNSSFPSCVTIPETYNHKFDINFISRDPNSISTSPECIDSIIANRQIRYTIHFENDGQGTASEIVIKTYLPEGIVFPENGANLFKCQIGVSGITVEPEPLFPNTRERKCYYKLNPANREIKFTIQNAGLMGTRNLNNINCKGDIKFNVRTCSATGIDKCTIPQCMYSRASITFDKNGEIMKGCVLKVGCNKGFKPCPVEFIDPTKGRQNY